MPSLCFQAEQKLHTIYEAKGLSSVSRVTRLSEFSPLGWLFTLGSICEILRGGQNNWATFSTETAM
jgi:hypothetical protein